MNHHPTKSPSSFPAKSWCVRFESKGSMEAERGTFLHAVFQYMVENDVQPYEEITKVFPELTLKEYEDLDWAIEEVYLKLEEFGFKLNGNKLSELVKKGLIKTENRIEIIGENFEVLTFGTIDLDAEYIIFDLKTGEIRNYYEQMAAYALGKMQNNPEQKWVSIIELYSKKRRSVEYQISDLNAEKVVFDLCKRIDSDEPPKPCDYCSWCIKSDTCEALIDLTSQVQDAREEFPKDFSFKSSEVTEKALDCLAQWIDDPTNEELKNNLVFYAENLAFLWRAANAANDFLEGVKSRIKTALKAGLGIPGLQIVERTGRASIKDPGKVFELSGLKSEEFLKCVSISKTDLVDLINPQKLEAMYLKAGIEIPIGFKNKTGLSILKSKLSEALGYFLEKNDLLEKGNPSYLITPINPTSKRLVDVDV